MKYRAEIDGLRALAVVPVMLFHAGFEVFSGGFVGVDVFFVISGFLITTIIIEELENEKFSLIGFYERRARRILPALFFMILVCIPFAWIWMLPDPLENFGQSVVATTLSANNILLFLTSGYWDLASEFKPLLHTWSLGVEEQYYILFPLLLIAFWRFGKKFLFATIVFVFLVSFGLGEWLSRESPEAAFFLIHTRAWELLAGSIAAFLVQKKQIQTNNPLALMGLVGIIFSIFAYDDTTPFPGVYTLVPVFGAVLLILFSDSRSWIVKLLSIRLFVGIGLISYSAYLWHQPLLAFAKIFSKNEPGLVVNGGLLLVTFLLAYLSWKYIEKPFRNKSLVSAYALVSTLVVSAFLLLGFGYSAHKYDGFVSRVFNDSLASTEIDITYNERNFAFKQNEFQHDDKSKILVVGNSFGRDFVNVLRETYNILEYDLIYRDDYDACSLFETKSGEVFASKADVIIFASNYRVNDARCNLNAIDYARENNSHVFFIGSKQFGFNHNWITRTDIKARALLRNPVMPETFDAELRAAKSIPADNYISIMQPLSNGDGVLVTDELGRLISPDRAHLTKYGAIYIGREVVRKSALNAVLIKP